MRLIQGGPVLANTVYANNKLIGENISVTLPAVTFATSDYVALGTLTLPNKAALENMEFSVTKPGIGRDLAALGSPDIVNYEVRGAQDELQPDGSMKTIGFKAFIRAVSGGLPSVEYFHRRNERERNNGQRRGLQAHCGRRRDLQHRPHGAKARHRRKRLLQADPQHVIRRGARTAGDGGTTPAHSRRPSTEGN
jgi:hypothetical protein